MPERYEVLAFTIHGRVTRVSVHAKLPAGSPPGSPRRFISYDSAQKDPATTIVDSEPRRTLHDVYQTMVDFLEGDASEKRIASELEQEIRRLLPPLPSLSVKAGLRFSAGSLEAFGTVVVTWLITTVLDIGKAEVQDVVRAAAELVINRNLSSSNFPDYRIERMRISCTRDVAGAEPAEREREEREPQPQPEFRELRRLQLLGGLTALVVLLLLFDRFFEVSPRRETMQPPQVTAPAAAAPDQRPSR